MGKGQLPAVMKMEALVKEGLARGSGGSQDMLISVCHGPSQDC